MMKEEVRHADNEKIDLKVWKRLVDYGLQYKARVIRTILVLLVVSGADLAYPLFTRYAINHFIVGRPPRDCRCLALCTFLRWWPRASA